MRRLAILACLALVSCFDVNQSTSLIDRWYAALATTNRAEFAVILADNATLTFDDISTAQTKAEFIESLDEWEHASKGAEIRHSVDETRSSGGETVSVMVCYKFPDNELLTREEFVIERQKIASSKQTRLADSCANYPNK